jgi:hypothetical protein
MKTPDDLGPIIRAAVVRFLEGAPAAMRDLKTAGFISEGAPAPGVASPRVVRYVCGAIDGAHRGPAGQWHT